MHSPHPTYADRIRERTQTWWGKKQSFAQKLHRLRELTRHHRPEDPDKAWRCCKLWQRTLHNKLNGRAFAQKHGAQVPENYWSGRCPQAIPWHRIPEEFVVKEMWNHTSRGAYVVSNGRDQLTGKPITRDEVIDRLDDLPPVLWMPLLVEEHVRRPDGSYGPPYEYKCLVFRDRVEGISMRFSGEQTLGFYTPDWELMPDRLTRRELAPKERPDCLEEIVETALRLGAACGVATRVDLFWTDRGCVFNEFSSVPAAGRGFSDFANTFLGDCWQRMIERFPDDPSNTSGPGTT